MNGLLELVKGPYDGWNVLGGMAAGVFGVTEYWILRRHLLGTLMRKAGDDEEGKRAALAMWRLVGPLAIGFGVLLVLVGFFEFGSILRNHFGS